MADRYLFILGHMRSRSSLLAHILMNHSSIYGLGESNKTYSHRLDFIKMRVKTRLYHKILNPVPFTFLDQINHNKKTPRVDLIKQYCKVIFLVRDPLKTYPSIKLLTKNYFEEWSHHQIDKYYIDRLTYLLDLRNQLQKNQYQVIDSNVLVENTEQTLQKLSDFLKLNAPLQPNYATYRFTGFHGDPSKNISSGIIVKTDSSEDYQPQISKAANLLYQQFKT